MSKRHFTDRELGAYRVQLLAMLDRVGGRVGELRAEALRPVGAETAEWADGATGQESDRASSEAEEYRALTLLGPEERILAEAAAAVDRLEDGTFGQCQGCRRHIPRARLDALPYARRCLRCEQTAEAGAGG